MPGREGLQRMFKGLAVTLILCLGAEAFASSDIREIWRNNQAVNHMTQKKVTEAHEEFTRLLAQSPFHPLFRFNTGGSFVATEEPDKAIAMYKEVLKLNPLPPEIEFATYFNLGFLNSLEGKDINEAVKNYQKALALQPNSKEVKTNIELLFKGGKGGGKGDNQEKSDDPKNQEGEEQPQEPQKFTNKPQPGQFEGKDMSKGDVKKILEELKKQEQRIRAKHQRKGKRQSDRDKNW